MSLSDDCRRKMRGSGPRECGGLLAVTMWAVAGLLLLASRRCGASTAQEEAGALMDIKAALGMRDGVLYGWDLDGESTPCEWERVTCDNVTMQLTGLNLTHLELGGSISPSISKLDSLRVLDMSENSMSGDIPSEIGDCLELRVIDLSYNYLVGEIPISLCQLKELQVLALQSNRLTGPLPPTLSQLPNLMTLNLAYNNLSGEIPALLYWSQTLQILMLRGNSLSGGLSPDICQLTSLWYFNVRENNLTGTIPPSIGNCSSFEILDLGYNQLTGGIPENFGFLQVSTLSLENNQFTGTIPEVIGLLTALLILDLSNNQLEGPIPTSFGNLIYLNKLYLHENKLTGPIPPVLGNMTRLQYMLLHENELTGTIPPELGNLPLFELRLADNRLDGGIPVSLSKCTSLNKLDLNGNMLTGAVPEELERLDNLTFLNLSSNLLSGSIPDQLASVVNLDTLDMSYNNLSGAVPAAIGRLEHLLFLSVEGNALHGELPAEMGNLSSLVYLDASRNRFSGGIPVELGGLQQLDTLLLDHNNFSGTVPAQLTGCIMLSTLDVSYNDLEGSVPTANNFSRFPASSFEGNARLCGAALNRECSGDRPRPAAAVGATTIWAVTAVAVCLVAVAIFAIVRSTRLRRSGKPLESGDKGGPPRVVIYHMGLVGESYEELVRITNNLTDQSVVGSGSSSKVYKCILKSGQAVAIKKLYSHHPQNLQEFENELQMLEKIKHRNLVALRGYSLSALGHFLLYDFMENGSLYDLLHAPGKKIKLDWSARLNIALGAAQGLAYLHHDCAPRIVHRDIKSGNILLDANLEPHISDFGIAKNMQTSKTHTSTYVMGTVGYIDPEYARTSKLNVKSDVYSYGIVLLELLTDRKAVNSEGNLLAWVMQRVSTDTVMSGVSPDVRSSCSNTNSIEKVLKLALGCTDKNPNVRPSMYDVVQVLLSLISGPVPAPPKCVQNLSDSAHQKHLDLFVNPMYYKDSLVSDSVTDGQLLAKFGEVISKHDP